MPYIFKEGDSKAACDRCGFTWNLSRLRLEWTNLMVCPRCYVERNQQEFIRGIPELPPQNARHVQSSSEVTFVSTALPPLPGLSGSGDSDTNIDLTAEGHSDWIHWESVASLNRKVGVNAKISNYTQVGPGTVFGL